MLVYDSDKQGFLRDIDTLDIEELIRRRLAAQLGHGVGEAEVRSWRESLGHMAIYASLDESDTRFDGNVARRHLTKRLALSEVSLAQADEALREAFADWHREMSSQITLHPRGPVILLPPAWR